METWKNIPSIEGYSVSDTGVVIPTGKNRRKQELSRQLTRRGYLRVSLKTKLGRKKFLAHRIVALAFIPNPENKPDINHKNGIKTDNRVENLEWCTPIENIRHSVENNLQTNFNQKSVQQLKNGLVIREYASIEGVRDYGFNPSAVRHLVSGAKDRKMHQGFEWRYTRLPNDGNQTKNFNSKEVGE